MKNSKRKGFLVPLLIIIIAVLVVGGGIYEYQNYQNYQRNKEIHGVIPPTTLANWKTYTDPELNFYFQYPSIWPKPVKTILGSGAEISTNGLHLEYRSNYNNATGNMEDISDVSLGIGGISAQRQKITFNNRDAIKITSSPCSSHNCAADVDALLVAFDSTHNLIISSDEGSQLDSKIFSSILDSFKFTNLDSQTSSDWKTYTNTQYGFSLKYPKSWYSSISPVDNFSLNQDWGKQVSENAIFQNPIGAIGTTVPYCEFHTVSYSNPKNLSIGDFWNNLFGSYESAKSTNNITFGENQISGTEFKMERSDQPLPNEQRVVITKNGSNFIVFLWWGQNPPSSQNSACASVDQVFSTFKFTN